VTTNEICVVHLVRQSNDISAFKNFLASYRRHAAGVPHDLLLVFKGFSAEDALAQYEALLDGVPHRQTRVLDFGYDVRPYVKVARDYSYRYFLFLNSFSQVLVPGWLEMLYRQVQRPRVGIVGATGSYQSISSDYHLFKNDKPRTLPAYKREVLPLYRYIRYTFAAAHRSGPAQVACVSVREQSRRHDPSDHGQRVLAARRGRRRPRIRARRLASGPHVLDVASGKSHHLRQSNPYL
jgi:hypothetical protein